MEKLGTVLAVGIEGKEEESKMFYRRIFNYGGTDSELQERGKNFRLFYSDEDRLKSALAAMALNSLLGDEKMRKAAKGKDMGLWKMANEKAERQFNSFINERFSCLTKTNRIGSYKVMEQMGQNED